MKYICHKRFKSTAICGEVNVPAGTELECVGGFISMNGRPLCYEHSENAHQHFAIDEDGNGMKRGKLTHEIQRTLQKRDSAYQKRWDKVWADSLCLSLKQKAHEDFFLWDNPFFTASIPDLEHIYNLIREV